MTTAGSPTASTLGRTGAEPGARRRSRTSRMPKSGVTTDIRLWTVSESAANVRSAGAAAATSATAYQHTRQQGAHEQPPPGAGAEGASQGVVSSVPTAS